MIDYSTQVFTAVANAVKAEFPEVSVSLQYLRRPESIPCITLDEISNVTALRDGSEIEQYARVTYRIQVFTAKRVDKRQDARKILNAADKAFYDLNFVRGSYAVTPELYRANFYCINATYEAIVDADGVFYRI